MDNIVSWEDFIFIVGADCQFGFTDQAESPDWSPTNTNWEKEIKKTKIAIEKVNTMKPRPKFFVICGDLTNAFPDEYRSLRDDQVIDLKKLFATINPDIKLICVCGNHDVGDKPTPDTINLYRSTYGDDYYSFTVNGVIFLVLNSQYYKDPSQVMGFAKQQDEWLDNQLEKSAGKRIICFSHIPFFNEDVDEPTKYSNIPIETRKILLDKLYDAGVRHLFFGHLHRNLLNNYKDMQLITTTAIGKSLGDDKSGLRIVTVTKNNVSHKFYTLYEFPKYADI